MTALTLKASMKLSLLAALLSAAAHAQPPDRTHLRAVSVAELKAIYLECDQAASTMVLDFGTAIDCSMVSEELLERGFGGSFERMLEWWHSVRNSRKECMQGTACETP